MNKTLLIVNAKSYRKAQEKLDAKIRQSWALGYGVASKQVTEKQGKDYWISVIVEVVKGVFDEHTRNGKVFTGTAWN